MILGFLLVYGVPAVLAYVFWLLVKRLVSYWTGRDVMLTFIPDPMHVHHTERILGIRRWKR